MVDGGWRWLLKETKLESLIQRIHLDQQRATDEEWESN